MHYNPFSYVHSEKDILKLVTTLMTNTKGEGSGGDPFWEKSERLLLTALIAYLHYEAPVEEQNFATLLEMLNTMQVLEDDEEYQNPVDLLFEELAKKKPNSFAGRQYKLYKLAAGKTAKSILISCGARLAPFDIQELRDLTMYDEVNTKCNLPAQIDIEATEGMEYEFLCVTKGGGSANKTYLYQETKAILNPETLVPFLISKIKTLGTAACPPYHIAFVIGGTSAEKNLLTVKLASTHFYDNLPTTGNEFGRAFRDVELEKEVLKEADPELKIVDFKRFTLKAE